MAGKRRNGGSGERKDNAWSAKVTLERLRAVPGPLVTQEDAQAFHDAVSMLQDAPTAAAQQKVADAADAELVRVVKSTLASRKARKYADELMFGMKMMLVTASLESVEIVVNAFRSGYAKDDYMWSVVLEILGSGHPAMDFALPAMMRPFPRGFAAISLLDAANTACREHGLKKHPFNTARGQQFLSTLLGGGRGAETSYAISACAAIPFLSPARRTALLTLAGRHKDPAVRIEVAWVMAKMGLRKGVEALAAACLDVNQSALACLYLRELKLAKHIPKAAKEKVFAAMAEMANWLSHPNEFGEPPDSIGLFDTRRIYWPPARKERTVYLFRYEYAKSRHRPKKDVGIGMVGTIMFALFIDGIARKSPEEIYGLHCCHELQWADDPRAPKKVSGKAGWKLIQSRA